MREIRQIKQEEKNLDSVNKPVQSSSASVDSFNASHTYIQKQLTELFSQMKKLDSMFTLNYSLATDFDCRFFRLPDYTH
jgi:hypothetical protein